MRVALSCFTAKATMTVTKDQIESALRAVALPSGEGDIVSAGMVSEPFITESEKGAKVMFSLNVPAEMAEQLEPLRGTAQAAVEALSGVASAMVALTAERKAGSAPSMAPPPPPPQAAPARAPEAAPRATR